MIMIKLKLVAWRSTEAVLYLLAVFLGKLITTATDKKQTDHGHFGLLADMLIISQFYEGTHLFYKLNEWVAKAAYVCNGSEYFGITFDFLT
jgi:hypothetical protein